MTYVGELGWVLLPHGVRAAPVGYALGSGRAGGMVAGGYKAIETARKGYRYWSAEISPDYTPYEAGLGFAVKLDKGDFIGREALVKQKQMG